MTTSYERLTECPALPHGWRRKEVLRQSGASAAKIEVSYVSPSSRVITNKAQLEKYLGGAWDLSRFDFESGRNLGGQTGGGGGGGGGGSQHGSSHQPVRRHGGTHSMNQLQHSSSSHHSRTIPSHSHGSGGLSGSGGNMSSAAAAALLLQQQRQLAAVQQQQQQARHGSSNAISFPRPAHQSGSSSGSGLHQRNAIASLSSNRTLPAMPVPNPPQRSHQLVPTTHGSQSQQHQHHQQHHHHHHQSSSINNSHQAIQKPPSQRPAPGPIRPTVDHTLVPPIRQTASIYKQPVTLVHTTSRETRPAPPNEVKQVATHGKSEKPKQVFWAKRLSGLRPKSPAGSDESESESAALPNRIFPVGPEIEPSVAVASLARALQLPNCVQPVTGQTGAKKTMDANPGVYVNPDQPLVQAVVVSDQDILAQSNRVQDARMRLEEAIKHFG